MEAGRVWATSDYQIIDKDREENHVENTRDLIEVLHNQVHKKHMILHIPDGKAGTIQH